MKYLLIGIIVFYRRCISPLKPPTCRFHPTCSEYGLIALRRHGAIRGSWLTIWRLLRCQPFGTPGYDPVPPDDPNPKSEFASDDGAAREQSSL